MGIIKKAKVTLKKALKAKKPKAIKKAQIVIKRAKKAKKPKAKKAKKAKKSKKSKKICTFKVGDGTGGKDKFLKKISSQQACARYVLKKDKKANGATWGPRNKRCYA